MKRRSGFTLIEILIVVAIIGMMLSVAVVSLTSGRDAARARAAARGVAQMSHYANALAILRQRPAVISFSGNTITVQLSGEGVDTSEVGQLALPIYQEVNGEDVQPLVVEQEEPPAAEPAEPGEAGGQQTKSAGYLHTENFLDPEELAKEDFTRSFEGILFRVEHVDEGGRPLEEPDAAQLRSEADAMVAKRAKAVAAASKEPGEDGTGSDDAEKPEIRPENEGRVIYETNGNCAPYNVIIFAATEDNLEGTELMTVHVSRSGKVTIGDEEDENRR